MLRYIMQTYVRPNMVFTRGEGARMYDATGKEYLDFAAGIAVNALGAACPETLWEYASVLRSCQVCTGRHCLWHRLI